MTSPLITDYEYASCYCEENIYKLIAKLHGKGDNRNNNGNNNEYNNEHWVCFISNDTKMCPVWMQKAGAGDPANPQPVFWDYHVVSITKVVVDNNNGGGGGGGLIVRDFDSVLPWGAEAGVYFDESFVNPVRDMRVKGLGIKEEFKPRFFVVPGKVGGGARDGWSEERLGRRTEATASNIPPS